MTLDPPACIAPTASLPQTASPPPYITMQLKSILVALALGASNAFMAPVPSVRSVRVSM